MKKQAKVAKRPAAGAVKAKKSTAGSPLSAELLRKMDAYWRASNYLSVGQIYLYDNPLLKQTLKREHVKPRLVGHWGTTPGLNLIYVHLNRVIKERDLEGTAVRRWWRTRISKARTPRSTRTSGRTKRG
jgi:xylulose-5-phosphate/fructose-6-phosphate phosphoketolase